MSSEEMSNLMDVLYNNITSNQAPGLTEYEKSLFLTKAEEELTKNYFNPKGNKYGEGFDDNQKRQMDFSTLMSDESPVITTGSGYFDARSRGVAKSSLPSNVWIIINEKLIVNRENSSVILTVKPISYEEYDRMMSKPFKRPLKNQAWRLITNASNNSVGIDLIAGPSDTIQTYSVRYVRRPKPIIVGDLDGLTINGYVYGKAHSDSSTPKVWDGCELNPIMHEEIVQRAVELAKVAWTTTGQENLQPVMQAGQRSE
jgi:hypothetical protein